MKNWFRLNYTIEEEPVSVILHRDNIDSAFADLDTNNPLLYRIVVRKKDNQDYDTAYYKDREQRDEVFDSLVDFLKA